MVYWQSVMKIRKQLGEVCHEKLLNTEFAWDRNSLSQADTVNCLTDLIDEDMGRQCIGKTKNEKAARSSGVVPAMVKAAGEAGLDITTDLVNQVVVGVIIVKWELSTIANC